MHDDPDTIFAVATGFGRAAIAVIRLSGAGTAAALHMMLGDIPSPRRASLRRLRDPGSGEVLDQALVLWLPGPASFTGEDQAELQIHGGMAVRAAIVGVLARFAGCRAAEPGEFTRRAFLNGRLDLSAVEGLADLIDAETEVQRRQAVRQLEGALADQVAAWRERLVDAAAALEAALDFADEDDVPAQVAQTAGAAMSDVAREAGAAIAGSARGERLRHGFTVVLAGPPNAGKSTLLNALARRDVAIVSPLPGTTRDTIEVRCDLGGLPVTFVDTAGLRETRDPVEALGIARTRTHIGSADLVLWLDEGDGSGSAGAEASVETIVVGTKADLAREVRAKIAVSAKTGDGLDELISIVRTRAERHLGGGDALVTRERHRGALRNVVESLDRGRSALAGGQDELAAEDLRLALRALGRITGTVDVDEVLDRIFGQFCIGK